MNKLVKNTFLTIILSSIGLQSATAETILPYKVQITGGRIPTTMVRDERGDWKPFIEWASLYFVGGGYPPKVRADQVTYRLNKYAAKYPTYTFLTHGWTDTQIPYICLTDVKGSDCKLYLYALRDNQDGEKVVDSIRKFHKGGNRTAPIEEAPCRTYLDLNAIRHGKKIISDKVCGI